MTIALILLVTGLALAATYAVFLRNDGYGARSSNAHPPRSHHADAFETHSFV